MTPVTVPTSAIAAFFFGMGYPFKAISLLSKLRLWTLASAAVVINIILLVGMVAIQWIYLSPYLDLLIAWISGLLNVDSFFYGLITAFVWIVWITSLVLFWVIGGVVLLLVGQAVASPFLDLLSEKTEAALMGTTPPSFRLGSALRALWMAITDLIWGMLWLVMMHGLIFVVGLLTGLAPLLSWIAGCLLLAQEFMGLPLTRQWVSYPNRFRLIWKNRWFSLGFGLSCTMMLVVPFLNFLLLPLATVGGTALYVELKRSGRILLGDLG